MLIIQDATLIDFYSRSLLKFALSGLIFVGISIYVNSLIPSIFAGVIACCCFWSIGEVNEQEKRVLKGWFKENPKRKEYYENLRKNNNLDK